MRTQSWGKCLVAQKGGGRKTRRFDLTASSGAPSEARGIVREVLTGWHVATDVADIAELLVSELVTNSVRAQSRTPRIGLKIRRLESGEVWAAVSDRCSGRPVLKVMPELEGFDDAEGVDDGIDVLRLAEDGRGLAMVGQLCGYRWGSARRLLGGNVVWFEVVASDEVAA